MKNFLIVLSVLFVSLNFVLAQSPTHNSPAIAKTHVLKTEFLAPVTGNLTLSYQTQLKPEISFQTTIGGIGIGHDINYEKPSGFFIKTGPRLMFPRFWTMDGIKRANPLAGFYFQPELAFSLFNYDAYTWTQYSSKKIRATNTSSAILLNFGIQSVLANFLVLDLYVAGGYGVNHQDYHGHNSNGNYYEDYSSGDKYGFFSSPESSVSGTAGFNIGILF